MISLRKGTFHLSRVSVILFLSLIATLLRPCHSLGSNSPIEGIVDIKENETSFERTINQPNTELWFVVFYEPWCHHSKKFIQTLDDIATTSLPAYHRRRVSFGKVDCSIDQNKSLCKKHEVQAYPFVKWYRDGAFHEYKGGRDHGDIVSFLIKMNKSVMDRKVTNYQEILEDSNIGDKLRGDVDNEESNGVTFVIYMTPYGNGDEDVDRRQLELESIRKVARHYQASNSFILLEPNELNEEWILTFANFNDDDNGTSQNNSLSLPLLIRMEKDLQPAIYPSSHDWTFSSLSHFIEEKKEVAVPFANENSIHELGHRRKYLAVAIIDPNDEKAHDFLAQIRQYVSSSSLSIRKQYQFVWINGKEWTSLLKKFSISLEDSPQLFVLDYPNDIYWTNPYQPHSPSSSDINRFLVDIDKAKILSINLNVKNSGRNIYGGYFGKDFDALMQMKNNPWFMNLELIICIFGIILMIPPSFGRVHDYIEKYIWQGVVDKILCYFGLIDNGDDAKKND